MKAAVVHRFDQAPTITEFKAPEAALNEVLIDVEAAALSRLTHGQASGRHYSSIALPFVPGVDGVGRLKTGERVYFAFPRAPWGAMAEQVVVDRNHVVPLPVGFDPVLAAALANPAMSSWAALKGRARLIPGERVLINGANGVSGRLAIRVARRLGASYVVVTARNEAARDELAELGADAFIGLSGSPEHVIADLQREMANGLHVILDYLWGSPAERIFKALMAHATVGSPQPLRFVSVGALAGASMSLPSAVLRSRGLELLGSGLGSLTPETLVQSAGAAITALATVLDARTAIKTRAVSIDEVHAYWNVESAERIVFTL
jgi:NADPH:quinone reductase-like Zn-dependent oxidoreductase